MSGYLGSGSFHTDIGSGPFGAQKFGSHYFWGFSEKYFFFGGGGGIKILWMFLGVITKLDYI